jgi:hypothetical protein
MNSSGLFACDINALSNDQRSRHQQLADSLRSAVCAVRELSDGYEFEFVPDRANYQALAELKPLEHACGPFFDVCIRLEREGGKLWWRLTGREGVKTFRAEFGPWFGGRAL